MIDIKIAHYATSHEIEKFNDFGMSVVYYVPSHSLYLMHPFNFGEFQSMMQSADFELSEFGENNA